MNTLSVMTVFRHSLQVLKNNFGILLALSTIVMIPYALITVISQHFQAFPVVASLVVIICLFATLFLSAGYYKAIFMVHSNQRPSLKTLIEGESFFIKMLRLMGIGVLFGILIAALFGIVFVLYHFLGGVAVLSSSYVWMALGVVVGFAFLWFCGFGVIRISFMVYDYLENKHHTLRQSWKRSGVLTRGVMFKLFWYMALSYAVIAMPIVLVLMPIKTYFPEYFSVVYLFLSSLIGMGVMVLYVGMYKELDKRHIHN